MPPSSSPRIISEEPAISRGAPADVDAMPLPDDLFVELRNSAQAASSPSGMLTKKIQRQFRKSTKSPPSVGPTTAEMAQTLAT